MRSSLTRSLSSVYFSSYLCFEFTVLREKLIFEGLVFAGFYFRGYLSELSRGSGFAKERSVTSLYI